MNPEITKVLEELKVDLKDGITEELIAKFKGNLTLRKEIFGNKSGTAEIERDQKVLFAKALKALKVKDSVKAKSLFEELHGKDLTNLADADGGYTVPEIFSNEIIRLAPQFGVVRANARIVDMSGVGDKRNFPTAGSVTTYRTNQKATLTADSITFGNVQLEPEKLTALVAVTNELIEDSAVAIVDLIIVLCAEALAKHEDTWGILGEGAGEGIFQTANVPEHVLSGNTYATVDADDLLSMLSLLDESALPNAKWLMSFSVFNALRGQKDSQGRYIVQEPAGGMPATIWNIPVVFSRVMPKTTDGGSQASKSFIALGDLNYMMVGVKGAMRVSVSDQATITSSDGSTALNLFERDMSAVRVIERVDIKLAEETKAFVKGTTGA